MIVANPVMIDAHRAGAPGNGEPFPDGAKIAKIEWKPKENEEAQFAVNVPDTLDGIGTMVRDGKQFPDTGGIRYAV